MRLLKKGDRIRLKVRTVGGFKGMATVVADESPHDDTIQFRPDGSEDDQCFACRHEVALIRGAKGAR